MTAQRSINSVCRYCRKPQLWAFLASAGRQVPLDRSPTGRVRLVRTDHQLLAEFLSLDELAVAMAKQREARARGEQPEQLYDLHAGECRAKANAAKTKGRRGPKRRGGRR